MAYFMVNVTLPNFMDEDFINLIPEQRAHVDNLMNEGKIESYALASDRTKLWVVMNVDSETKAVKILRNFPIFEYVEYEIIELAFYNSSQFFFPSLSLN
jgi:muconolactone delta-isomerase